MERTRCSGSGITYNPGSPDLHIHCMFRRVLLGGIGASATAAAALSYKQSLAEEKMSLKMGIFAPPGGGKGTVCKKLVRDYGFVQVSTGDLLRDAVKNKTPLGMKAKEYMNKGELVPADLIHEIVGSHLKSPEVMQKGFILDGVCRSKANSEFIVDEGLTPDLCLILDVTEACVQERLGGRVIDPVTKDSYHLKFVPPPPEIADRCIRRKDDYPEAITKRFNLYQKGLKEVLSVFPPATVKKIPGEGAPKDVYLHVQKKVDETLAHKKMESLFEGGADPKKMMSALNALSWVLTRGSSK
mmetsp:Transcript_36325/g.58777  ORF Transcript_36325/g.58777 Transcript_36325/m.58777 type:complete len:299 (+) Transcript_36325:1178-2074(+)